MQNPACNLMPPLFLVVITRGCCLSLPAGDVVPPRAAARRGGAVRGGAVAAGSHLRSLLPAGLVQVSWQGSSVFFGDGQAAGRRAGCQLCAAAGAAAAASCRRGDSSLVWLERQATGISTSLPWQAELLPSSPCPCLLALFCSIADYERLFKEQGLTGERYQVPAVGPAFPAAPLACRPVPAHSAQSVQLQKSGWRPWVANSFLAARAHVKTADWSEEVAPCCAVH